MKKLSPLFLTVILASSIFSQQIGPPPAVPAQKAEDVEVVRITTNLVQVDAVITDNHGKLVTD